MQALILEQQDGKTLASVQPSTKISYLKAM